MYVSVVVSCCCTLIAAAAVLGGKLRSSRTRAAQLLLRICNFTETASYIVHTYMWELWVLVVSLSLSLIFLSFFSVRISLGAMYTTDGKKEEYRSTPPLQQQQRYCSSSDTAAAPELIVCSAARRRVSSPPPSLLLPPAVLSSSCCCAVLPRSVVCVRTFLSITCIHVQQSYKKTYDEYSSC